MDLINMIGASATILMGCLGLFFPNRASAFTGLTASTVEARAEFRGTLGITFILLGFAYSVFQFATFTPLQRSSDIDLSQVFAPASWA